MVSIIEIHALREQKLQLKFNDGSTAQVDLGPMLSDTPLTRPLRDFGFFEQVRIYDDGDGVFWPNDFDLGADMLHDYVATELVSQ